MKLSLSPSGTEQFRDSTKRQITFSAQRYCAGCKKRRSLPQFDGEAVTCKQCVRRAG